MRSDRIHFYKLVDGSKSVEDISLHIDPTVKIELDQKIIEIDKSKKRIFSKNSMFSYDKLIVATGSPLKTPFDITGIENVAVFRSANDCKK